MWVAAILGSTILPAWSLVTPRVAPESIEPVVPGNANLDRVAGSFWVDIEAFVAPGFGERFETYLIAMWIAASVLILSGLSVGSWRLHRKAGTWTPRRIAGHEVLVSEDFGPAAFGVRSAAIVVPRWLLDHGEETVALVCLHEAQHRAARDPALLTGAAIAAALMPWNVALWWQVSRLRSAVELDCDERVVAAGARRTTYASTLLSIGAGAHSYGLVMPGFAPSVALLERRLTMLINGAAKAGRAKTAVSLVAVAGLTALGCGVPAPVESPAPEPAVASSEPPVVSDAGVSGGPAPERHPSVFDNPPPAAAADVVPYRPVVSGADDVRRYRPAVMGMESIRLFFIDGERVEPFDWRALDPNEVESIEIGRGPAAAARFGPEAWDGVVNVVMKPN
jgi:hypothetical protein